MIKDWSWRHLYACIQFGCAYKPASAACMRMWPLSAMLVCAYIKSRGIGQKKKIILIIYT